MPEQSQTTGAGLPHFRECQRGAAAAVLVVQPVGVDYPNTPLSRTAKPQQTVQLRTALVRRQQRRRRQSKGQHVGVSFKSGPARLHGHRPQFRGPERKSLDDFHGCEHRLFRHLRRFVVDDREGAKHDSARVFLRLPQRPFEHGSFRGIWAAEHDPQSTQTRPDHRRAQQHGHDQRDVGATVALSRGRAASSRSQLSFLRYRQLGGCDGRHPVGLRLGGLGP